MLSKRKRVFHLRHWCLPRRLGIKQATHGTMEASFSASERYHFGPTTNGSSIKII